MPTPYIEILFHRFSKGNLGEGTGIRVSEQETVLQVGRFWYNHGDMTDLIQSRWFPVALLTMTPLGGLASLALTASARDCAKAAASSALV